MSAQQGDGTHRHGAPPGGRLRCLILRCLIGCCYLGLVLVCAVWSPPGAAPVGWDGPPSVQAQDRPAASNLRQRQVAFLHRLRHADPRYQMIEQAVLNAHNKLGVILARHVEMEAVRPLMRTLLTQMAKAFPRQHLTVIAYAPSEPPLQIGTARFNARTRQMPYTSAVPQ